MSWDLVLSNGTSNENEVKYAKLPVGQTTVRILDDAPVSYIKHWIQRANNGKGMSIVCIGTDCPICKENFAAKKQGLQQPYNYQKVFAINAHVIKLKEGNNTTEVNEVQIIEKGKKLFVSLHGIMEMIGGDLKSSDIIISRTGADFNNTNYNVMPVFPPRTVSAEEMADLTSKKYNLSEVAKKLTVDQIKILMEGGTLAPKVDENTPNIDTSEPAFI